MRLSIALALILASAPLARAADLVVPLAKDTSVERRTAAFQCDAEGVKLGLPTGPFVVEYLVGGDNDLAVLPIHARPLIFARVFSADGARYASGRYVWWDVAGRSVTLSAETTEGHKDSTCKPADKP